MKESRVMMRVKALEFSRQLSCQVSAKSEWGDPLFALLIKRLTPWQFVVMRAGRDGERKSRYYMSHAEKLLTIAIG